jgi:hypothetical protein
VRGKRLLGLLAVLVAACGGGGATNGGSVLNPRPGDAPDVVLLSVSGHDGALNAVLCTSDTNRSYLADPGEAVDGIVAALQDRGLTVEVANFADRLAAPDLNQDGQPDNTEQYGFSELLATMEDVYDNWMAGFDNPTKLVIVAHSHGAVWAHVATSVMSHVPVSCLVTLDGVCLLWDCEHADEVTAWVAANSVQVPWDIAHPCGIWQIPGKTALYDTKDVAFDNVVLNLEVESSDPFVSDCCENVRLDGSSKGILTFVSGESHNEVRQADGAAMTWVEDTIRLQGLP